jgi:hypothetical protein
MAGYSCRLVPGMYLSGREAQLLHCYAEGHRAFITQHGVPVREGEGFEVEMWARAQHRPVMVKVGLTLAGQKPPPESTRRWCLIWPIGIGGRAGSRRRALAAARPSALR